MMTKETKLLNLYTKLPRQVPGIDTVIGKALSLTDLDTESNLAVLNIGCGTGAQALGLARYLKNADIAAIDKEKSYLRELDFRKSSIKGGRIETVFAHPHNLPVVENAVDLIWSEATAPQLGFKKTLEYWKKFLKPGGYIILSELSWLTYRRPKELEDFWVSEYPEMATVSQKINQIQYAGLSPSGHVVLPREGWTENFYDPILEKSHLFLNRNKGKESADIIKEIFKQMNMYSKYNDYYNYVYYVIRKKRLTEK
jgi:ubiquinone/menaquinone biosynthesis C-methylase UbiE